jgi:predicted RNA-binding protein (virulence factor B family)
MPFDESSLGLSVVIDQKYQGMIYANEIFSPVELGIEVTGFVKAVRPDGLVDVSLQPVGMTNVHHSRDIILEALKQEGGFLGLHDKSPPEAIKARLGMSKQNFKRAVGILYKARIIELADDGLKLLKKSF